MSSDVLARISGLRKTYALRKGTSPEGIKIDDAGRHVVLDDVDLTLYRGETLGLVGINGAGKSTMLKIMSRVVEPDAGRIELWGRVSSLLEVGTGFHPDLTGKENVFLSGAALGMSRKEIARHLDEIIAFASLESHINKQVKRYSSGMYVRLAFSVAAHLAADVLLLDEVFAVGDATFQAKCIDKVAQLRASADRGIILVSHSMVTIASACTRGVLLDGGRVSASGPIRDVVAAYTAVRNQSHSAQIGMWDHLSDRINPATGEHALIEAVALTTEEGTEQATAGEPLTIRVQLAHNVPDDVRIVVGFRSPMGPVGAVTSPPSHPRDGAFSMRFDRLPLAAGSYALTVDVLDSTSSALLDQVTLDPGVEVLTALTNEHASPLGALGHAVLSADWALD